VREQCAAHGQRDAISNRNWSGKVQKDLPPNMYPVSDAQIREVRTNVVQDETFMNPHLIADGGSFGSQEIRRGLSFGIREQIKYAAHTQDLFEQRKVPP
jgi:hypothetical protein